ncbi:MarR family transcriptional regulator [Rhodococcus sp. SGAir0479]|nr:MarR family transcriptional regulator [Rhodococcus sp. SGAir0479]
MARARVPVLFGSVTSDTRALASDLSLAVVRLTRHLRGRRSEAQVSLTQLSALATLSAEGSMTPGSLAAREKVQPPSMTRVIASLADLGLVDRTPHPTDGRQIIVSLSDSGHALMESETAAREAWMTEKLSSLEDKQLETLRDAVSIITTLVEND